MTRATRRDWIGLIVIALPCVLYAMDLTVLDLALPTIRAQLRPGAAELLWIADIYGFMVAGSLITMGTLGDRIGRRRLLMIGAAAFALGSAAAALSTTAPMLIAARALLGIAGATLAPSTLSLIRNMFLDPAQRTTAIGIWAMSYSIGGAAGPVVGGLLLEHFRWTSIFLIAIPVMALLLVAAPLVLPEFRPPSSPDVDVLGAAQSIAAVLAVTYGLKRIAEHGVEVAPLACIAGGAAIGVLFLRRQQRIEAPLIDLSLFRLRAFTVPLALYFIATFVAFAAFLFSAQYLQLVLGLTPLRAGAWLLPTFAGYTIGSMLAPWIAGRIERRWVMSAGMSLAAIGFALLAGVAAGGAVLLAIATFTFAIGLGPVVTLATDSAVGAASAAQAGVASAISETGSELGGALGIATLGSLANALYRHNVGFTHAFAVTAAVCSLITVAAAAGALLLIVDTDRVSA